MKKERPNIRWNDDVKGATELMGLKEKYQLD
jgi:hypothetical protein